jgi:protein SCO1/2
VQQRLGDRVGRDIFIYSITIDPEHDTPPVLKRYMEAFQVGPGWTFLTGQKQDIDLIRKKLGLYKQDTEGKRSDHTTNLMLGNEATGLWIRHSTLEDAQYLTAMIGGWLSNWQEHKVVRTYAEVPQIPPQEKGQYLFKTRCLACHTFGHGDGVGPDLAGVTSQRDRAWLARWLAAPDEMLAQGDPIATALLAKFKNIPMPNLRLSETDVAALITYMEAQSQALQDPDKHKAAHHH